MKTCSIIDPPVRNGGMAASSSYRPYSTPTPAGPQHLVPGERGEIDAQRGQVDRHVRNRLAGVEAARAAERVRYEAGKKRRAAKWLLYSKPATTHMAEEQREPVREQVVVIEARASDQARHPA